ncbi:hypothetical protein AB4037_01030 [Labrys sp. KB_33_2]|uniref:hypothetical protein n=1 Tax=Labrys sp. KB_33_2 TaxID=3237479 RepID=UPI003F8F7AF8
MPQLDEIVVSAVALSGGSLVGRIRLQKIIYLLDQLGLSSGAPFEYHHYGPYSEAVSDAVTDAKFWSRLEEATVFRKSDGAPYSTFKTEAVGDMPALGGIDTDRARTLLMRFAGVSSTVLELAATVHWLAFNEKVADWRAEIEVRKAGKTDNGRLEKAVTLLKELGIAPAGA